MSLSIKTVDLDVPGEYVYTANTKHNNENALFCCCSHGSL